MANTVCFFVSGLSHGIEIGKYSWVLTLHTNLWSLRNSRLLDPEELLLISMLYGEGITAGFSIKCVFLGDFATLRNGSVCNGLVMPMLPSHFVTVWYLFWERANSLRFSEKKKRGGQLPLPSSYRLKSIMDGEPCVTNGLWHRYGKKRMVAAR